MRMFGMLIFIYAIATAFQGVMAGSFAQDTESPVNVLMAGEIITWADLFVLKVPVPNLGYFTAIWQVLNWNFPWFDNTPGFFIHMILFSSLTIGMVYLVITQFAPVLISAAAVLRRLLPG